MLSSIACALRFSKSWGEIWSKSAIVTLFDGVSSVLVLLMGLFFCFAFPLSTSLLFLVSHFRDSVEKVSALTMIYIFCDGERTIDALADFSFRSNIQVSLWSEIRPAQKS